METFFANKCWCKSTNSNGLPETFAFMHHFLLKCFIYILSHFQLFYKINLGHIFCELKWAIKYLGFDKRLLHVSGALFCQSCCSLIGWLRAWCASARPFSSFPTFSFSFSLLLAPLLHVLLPPLSLAALFPPPAFPGVSPFWLPRARVPCAGALGHRRPEPPVGQPAELCFVDGGGLGQPDSGRLQGLSSFSSPVLLGHRVRAVAQAEAFLCGCWAWHSSQHRHRLFENHKTWQKSCQILHKQTKLERRC